PRTKDGLMNFKSWMAFVCAVVAGGIGLIKVVDVDAGETPPVSGYKVFTPIREGNLTIFPVVAAKSHGTDGFLTLDEGLKTGDVVVSESGRIAPLIRRRPSEGVRPVVSGGPQVNTLVLVNNAKRPLLLLAGEIVTGGKQDRVIAKDRLIPAES